MNVMTLNVAEQKFSQRQLCAYFAMMIAAIGFAHKLLESICVEFF